MSTSKKEVTKRRSLRGIRDKNINQPCVFVTSGKRYQMIATDLLRSDVGRTEREKLSTLFHETASLFPLLSFGQSESAEGRDQTGDVVWIEGTVTVSF